MSPRTPTAPVLDPREARLQSVVDMERTCAAKQAELQPIIDAADLAIEAGRRARCAKREAEVQLELTRDRVHGELIATADPAIQVLYDEIWEFAGRVRSNMAEGPPVPVFQRILRDLVALKLSAAHDIPEQLARLRAEAQLPPSRVSHRRAMGPLALG